MSNLTMQETGIF